MVAAGLWALLGAASLVLGAAVALRWRVPARRVGEAMGFGAGALVGALAYELVPDRNLSDGAVWVGFGAGALTFYVLDGLITSTTRGGGGTELALGALLDGVPESLVLGMGLAFGGNVTVGFLVAVFVSNLPEGLSSAAEMRDTHSPGAIYRLWLMIALVSGLAGAVGYVLADIGPASDGRVIQAFAGGAVLTMLADSMFPEAFRNGGRVVAPLTALGFAVAALLTTLD